MMDPRREQGGEEKRKNEVKSIIRSGRPHNFVRRFKLINAAFRKEAGSRIYRCVN